MPRKDEFDQYDADFDEVEGEVLEPEVDDELARARALVAAADGPKPRGNRKERRAQERRPRPAGAPEPQDHLPKKTAQQAEADGGELYRITLFEKDFDVDPQVFTRSIDFMEGRMDRDPMMMARGVLGAENLAWVLQRARIDGIDGVDVSTKIMKLVREAAKGNR